MDFFVHHPSFEKLKSNIIQDYYLKKIKYSEN